MLSLALALALSQSPTMAGAPVAAVSSRNALDYSTSLYAAGPTTAEQCTNTAITTDQGGAVTVTRASTAWCETATGNMSLIDNDKAVVESDGLRIEAASSNRLAFSEVLHTNWTPTNATAGSTRGGPDGSTITTLSTSSSGGYYESAAFTITGTSAVASMWVAGSGAGTYAFVLRDTTAGADRCTSTGTPPASFTSMKTRPSCSSAAIVSGNNHVLRAYPGGTAGTGSNVGFWGAQVEPAITVKTSYIKTTGTAATRALDNVSITTADGNTSGCFSATFWTTTASFPRSIATNPATLGQYNNTVTLLGNDGTNTATSNTVANMTDRSATVRTLWGGSSLQIGLDGVMGTAASYDGTMGTGTTLYLGSLSGTSRQFGGWLKKVKFGTTATGCAL